MTYSNKMRPGSSDDRCVTLHHRREANGHGSLEMTGTARKHASFFTVGYKLWVVVYLGHYVIHLLHGIPARHIKNYAV